jgi:hypothetical protein
MSYFPNEAQKKAYLSRTKENLMKPVKRVLDLLVREQYNPASIDDSEAIELQHYAHEMAEQAAKDAANGKTHGFMSFEEFAAKQRSNGGE